MMRKNVGVEWLRCLCIICVVWLHCLRPYFVEDKWPWEEALRVALDCATPSFFFMSGFLLPRRPDGLQKRLVRIVTPYVAASLVKFVLEVASARARVSFWRGLLLELRLTHLAQPSPFKDGCVPHEELAPLEGLLGYDDDVVEGWWSDVARRLATGGAFGHYYFVPVLAQLHLLAHVLVQPRDTRVVARLTVFCALWYPARTYVSDALQIPNSVSWRLPFMWLFQFLAGFHTKHVVLDPTKRNGDRSDGSDRSDRGDRSSDRGDRSDRSSDLRTLATALASLAVGAAGAGSAAVARAAALHAADAHGVFPSWREVGVFLKDVYVVALPAAVCIYGAIANHDLPSSEDPEDPSSRRRRRRRCFLVLLLRRTTAFVVGDLARFSYFIYLYHGFFLHRPWLPFHWWVVLAATLALGYVIELIAKPQITAKVFGISPRDSSSSSSTLAKGDQAIDGRRQRGAPE